MALTSYGEHNLVIEQDYNLRFNEIVVGDPQITISSDTSGNVDVDVNVWYGRKQEETARWRYVGMEYSTAQNAANNIRNALTFQQYSWEFGTYLSGGNLQIGYYKSEQAPRLESDIAVVKNGNGAMYDVVVDAHVTGSDYVTSPGSTTSQNNLQQYLQTLQGWNNYKSGWNVGKSISAAGADNIVLVTAPTRTREFEIAGQDIMPKGGESGLSSVTFPMWYRCTDTYRCQVKYTGMTLNACRNLYTQLNNNNGWYLSVHPYKYEYNSQAKNFNWTQDVSSTTYQCLNEFRSTKGDGNMWTAELDLCQEVQSYTTQPNNVSQWSWPALWSSKIPGLSTYLV